MIAIIAILIGLLPAVQFGGNRMKCTNNLKQPPWPATMLNAHRRHRRATLRDRAICRRATEAAVGRPILLDQRSGRVDRPRDSMYGPLWVMHVYACMESPRFRRITRGDYLLEEMEQACRGQPRRLPRRPEIDTNLYPEVHAVPGSPQSEVQYNDRHSTLLKKLRHLLRQGCRVDATRPETHPSRVFGIVRKCEVPLGERFGIGKGTAIAHVTDGSSNTVMLSEVLAIHQADGRTSSTAPSGMNRDVRGAMLVPMAGGNIFMGNFPPNSMGTDPMPSCDPSIIPASQAAMLLSRMLSSG